MRDKILKIIEDCSPELATDYIILLVNKTLSLADEVIVEMNKSLSAEECESEAEAFTKHKMQMVSSLLSEDYKIGYKEGVEHYLNHKTHLKANRLKWEESGLLVGIPKEHIESSIEAFNLLISHHMQNLGKVELPEGFDSWIFVMTHRILRDTGFAKIDVGKLYHFAIKTAESEEYAKLRSDLSQISTIGAECELINFICEKYISENYNN